jgi:threonine/homoserine/homoserine lactone efflux protein
MTPEFIRHLQHNWPLAAVVVVLFLYLPVVLLSGTFFTNQGRILRSKDPSRYWRWVASMSGLFLLCLGVLVGSYYMSGA